MSSSFETSPLEDVVPQSLEDIALPDSVLDDPVRHQTAAFTLDEQIAHQEQALAAFREHKRARDLASYKDASGLSLLTAVWFVTFFETLNLYDVRVAFEKRIDGRRVVPPLLDVYSSPSTNAEKWYIAWWMGTLFDNYELFTAEHILTESARADRKNLIALLHANKVAIPNKHYSSWYYFTNESVKTPILEAAAAIRYGIKVPPPPYT